MWISYYYNGRDAQGKRKEIPLGADLDQAKVEWARLERRAAPKPSHLLGSLFDRYVKEIIPTKGLRTQSDNMKELKQLRKAFEKAPIASITPQVVAQYRDARTAKVRANREIALLSHMFTIAREWGLASSSAVLSVRPSALPSRMLKGASRNSVTRAPRPGYFKAPLATPSACVMSGKKPMTPALPLQMAC